MNKYINLISYFGGKFPILKWLISKFPKGNYHFVDTMGGSGNVSLNVEYPLITYNDVNNEVINLYNVLRNDYEEFLRLVYFTPFSRSELNKIITDAINEVPLSDIERARRYFVKSQLGYGANGSQNNHYGTGFEWKTQRSNFYRIDNWNIKLERLAKIVDKLRHFQIENRDALELFDKINRKDVIAYFDPPYLLDLRKSKKRYTHEVDNDFHIRLSNKVKNAKCYVAISGYDHPLYDELFGSFYKSIAKINRSNVGKIPQQECLWTNYDPENHSNQLYIKFK